MSCDGSLLAENTLRVDVGAISARSALEQSSSAIHISSYLPQATRMSNLEGAGRRGEFSGGCNDVPDDALGAGHAPLPAQRDEFCAGGAAKAVLER